MINAFIASRLGSTRVPFKNLRNLAGKPLYEYLTDEALNCLEIDNLYLNTDSRYIINAAEERYKDKLNYYLRPSNLGTSDASLDAYVYDFMNSFPSEITIFLNPCSFKLCSKTIDSAIKYFVQNNLDSCVASYEMQTHCFFNNQPVNFKFNKEQPRSQDLIPLHAMTSGFFIWRNETFISNYKNFGYANFFGKFESYAISKAESFDIDSEEDFIIAEKLLSGSSQDNISYHQEINDLVNQSLLEPN